MRFNRRHRVRGWVVAAITMSLLVAVTSTSAPGTVGQSDADDAAGVVSSQQAVRPQLPSRVNFALRPSQSSEPISAEAVRRRVQQAWKSPRLGDVDARAIVVRDAISGEELVDLSGDEPLTPASLTKVVSAAAIMAVLPPEHTFATRVVRGPTPRDVVVVAGGDQLLSGGNGSARAVAGRAGLSDLAGQTARSLAASDDATTEPVRVWLDTAYADGPSRPPGWTDFWLDNGFAGRITMLGLEQDRALPYDPSPRDPAMVAAQSFRESLAKEGISVADGQIERVDADSRPSADEAVQRRATPDEDESPPRDQASSTAQAGMQTLAEVESAPLRDVLALALATSDNAMIEQLSRQAALADGAATDQDSINAWVLRTLSSSYDIDTSQAELVDTSGLSDGTKVSMEMIAQTLVAGTSGRYPALQSVLTGLPIAGLSGTLTDRFGADSQAAGRGVVRAKTGSLPQVTSLAGTVNTRDGRLLVFAMTSNDVDGGPAGIETRAAIDDMVASLAACGC
ncbi:D-alanyl-D-alanine carboxypeptidase/D-alanyl-D-alanine-endopeptidase [soil metagenome]